MTIKSVRDRLDWGAQMLLSAGIKSPRREARLLLSQAMGRPVEWIFAHPEADCTSDAPYEVYVARRKAREPMSYILGVREFRSLCFEVSPDVLDPRPDSEVLVEVALALVSELERPIQVLDLGTGSGCLLLSILSECKAAFGIGTDISEAGLLVASRNARRLGLTDRARFVRADWGDGIKGRFDLVLSNPPYIPASEIGDLEPEISCHEPRLALDGGFDGLEAYRALAKQALWWVTSKTVLIIELGEGQAGSVREIFAQGGFTHSRLEYDLAGKCRCLIVSATADTLV